MTAEGPPPEPVPSGNSNKVAPANEEAPQAPKPLWKRSALLIWDLICEHWFLLGLGFAIGFAYAVPDFGRPGGWIAAEWTIKYGAVIVIFFLSGLSLKTKALLNAAARLHFHLFIQSVSLVITPAIGYGIARGLMKSSMDEDLVNGLVVAMCMPTTISTNVVFTKQAGGNEAAALINAVIGNIIGIFVSPGWLYLYLGRNSQAPYEDVILQLLYTIIIPLAVGQVVQYMLPEHVKRAQAAINFGKVGNVMILLLVWSTFCNAFYQDIQLGADSWVPMLFLEWAMFFAFCALILAMGTFALFKRVFSMDKPDAVALLMCGSTKTLALGMPLISALYGKNANAGILSLPLLIYHATQILFGSLMLKHLKKWVDKPTPGVWPKRWWPVAEEACGTEGGSIASSPTNAVGRSSGGSEGGAGQGHEAGGGKDGVVVRIGEAGNAAAGGDVQAAGGKGHERQGGEERVDVEHGGAGAQQGQSNGVDRT